MALRNLEKAQYSLRLVSEIDDVFKKFRGVLLESSPYDWTDNQLSEVEAAALVYMVQRLRLDQNPTFDARVEHLVQIIEMSEYPPDGLPEGVRLDSAAPSLATKLDVKKIFEEVRSAPLDESVWENVDGSSVESVKTNHPQLFEKMTRAAMQAETLKRVTMLTRDVK